MPQPSSSDRRAALGSGLAIEQGGLFRPHEPDRGLSNVAVVAASLSRLRRNHIIEAEKDGNTWRVRWGRRALDIARQAGVDVTE